MSVFLRKSLNILDFTIYKECRL
ncbi:hypothetical protein BCEN4_540008 [Burkholderia cenocepacia]|nr:hypothetical protein BCEN4_540008 [Burkholderia cenocepacia]